MNEEEKKAIETLKSWKDYNIRNKNKLLESVEIIKVQEIILNLIEKLQKENKELKNDYENLSNSVVVKNHYIKNSIPVQKVKDKIEQLKKNLYTVEHYETVGAINVLQGLLERRK